MQKKTSVTYLPGCARQELGLRADILVNDAGLPHSEDEVLNRHMTRLTAAPEPRTTPWKDSRS